MWMFSAVDWLIMYKNLVAVVILHVKIIPFVPCKKTPRMYVLEICIGYGWPPKNDKKKIYISISMFEDKNSVCVRP